MTKQGEREASKTRLRDQLKRRVRAHRPAAKVLEIAVAMAEERIETMEEQVASHKWQLEYLKSLKPEAIEPDEKS